MSVAVTFAKLANFEDDDEAAGSGKLGDAASSGIGMVVSKGKSSNLAISGGKHQSVSLVGTRAA